MRIWRLCKAKYANDAFLGQGARLFGGRWNPVGVSIVYTSPSLALASIELYVHLDPSLIPSDFVAIAGELPEDADIERIEIEELPADWRAIDHPDLKKLGADWIASGRSLALEVPSAAVEGEWNILLNPSHPDFQKISLDTPLPWKFNDRMFRIK